MIQKDLITMFISTLYVGKNIAQQIGNRCHYSSVPKSQANMFPRIFLQRTSINNDGDLDGSKGDFVEEYFDLEVISNSLADVETVTDYLWSDIHLYFGLIGATKTVKGMFLESQSDDYEYKGLSADLGEEVAAFSLKVIHSFST